MSSGLVQRRRVAKPESVYIENPDNDGDDDGRQGEVRKEIYSPGHE